MIANPRQPTLERAIRLSLGEISHIATVELAAAKASRRGKPRHPVRRQPER